MTPAKSSQTIDSIDWRVTGMDCASCAAKIKGAIEPVPGVEDAAVSVMAQTLTVSITRGTDPS
ncbi:MAG TPA: heavy metal-associated domain-containing protein, partial [Hyphomonas sp.]|nr:heavy metal-associated domain-containing protein [Hyphomonas sp.]